MYIKNRDSSTERIRTLCYPGVLSLLIIVGIMSAKTRDNKMNKIEIMNDENILMELTQGQKCILDKSSYNTVKDINWSAMGGLLWYAVTNTRLGVNKRTVTRMHRLLVGAKSGQLVDHINGNTLDNRISNLRICTKAENNRNSKTPSNNTSGFKGVHKEKRYGKWVAQISFNNKKIWLGYHSSPELAHKAYQNAALKYHGEFSRFG